jgi:hypothetical protein
VALALWVKILALVLGAQVLALSVEAATTGIHCTAVLCDQWSLLRLKYLFTSHLGGTVSPHQQLTKYLDMINSADFDSDDNSFDKVFVMDQFKDPRPQYEGFFLCTLVTSAPAERILSRVALLKCH